MFQALELYTTMYRAIDTIDEDADMEEFRQTLRLAIMMSHWITFGGCTKHELSKFYNFQTKEPQSIKSDC